MRDGCSTEAPTLDLESETQALSPAGKRYDLTQIPWPLRSSVFYKVEIMAVTQRVVTRHKANTVCEDVLKTEKEQLNGTPSTGAAQ